MPRCDGFAYGYIMQVYHVLLVCGVGVCVWINEFVYLGSGLRFVNALCLRGKEGEKLYWGWVREEAGDVEMEMEMDWKREEE